MSERIVMMGPQRGDRVACLQVSPMDAGAFLAGPRWRVSLTLFVGDFANATVLVDREQTSEADWETYQRICVGCKEFEVATPIPLAGFLSQMLAG